MKTILLLGSGMMAETVINYLLINPNVCSPQSSTASISPVIYSRSPRNSPRKKDSKDVPTARLKSKMPVS